MMNTVKILAVTFDHYFHYLGPWLSMGRDQMYGSNFDVKGPLHKRFGAVLTSKSRGHRKTALSV